MKSGVHHQKVSQASNSDLSPQTVSPDMPKDAFVLSKTDQETKKKGLGLSRMTIETLGGTAGGIAATIVSHPLDTVKV